jgi:hypothetical protein
MSKFGEFERNGKSGLCPISISYSTFSQKENEGKYQ